MKQRSGFTLTFDLKKIGSRSHYTQYLHAFVFVKSEPDWDKERSNTVWTKIYRRSL